MKISGVIFLIISISGGYFISFITNYNLSVMKAILVFVLLSFSFNTFSQVSLDTLTVKKVKWKQISTAMKNHDPISNTYRYSRRYLNFQAYKNGIPLNLTELDALMKTNNDAYLKFLAAKGKMKSFKNADKTFATLGLIATGATLLGKSVSVDDSNKFITISNVYLVFMLSTITIGLIVESSLKASAYNLGKEAGSIYNRGIRNVPKLSESVLTIGLVAKGVGVRINF